MDQGGYPTGVGDLKSKEWIECEEYKDTYLQCLALDQAVILLVLKIDVNRTNNI